MNTKKLSIVVPCYNEDENIPFIFEAFDELLKRPISIEIIIVNNGSTDQSNEVIQKEIRNRSGLPYKVITLTQNKGYGNGILQGLDAANGEVLAWTHADLQTDPLDIIRAFNVYQENPLPNRVIKGIRLERHFLDHFFTWGMQKIASWLLHTPLHDINAQPKLFSSSFYNQYIRGEAPLDFSLDLFLLYKAANNGKIDTIPVYFKKRIYGEAKGGGTLKGKIKLIKRTWKYMLRLKKDIDNNDY